MQPPLTLYLFPQSPWSRKAKAVLNYKEIPVKEVPQDLVVRHRVIKPALGPQTGPILWGADGPRGALTDSTAIAMWAEEFKPEPSIRHDDPGLEVVSHLFEEMIDEWISRQYLSFRWFNAADRRRNLGLMMKTLAPWLPGFAQEKLGERLAQPILAALPRLGVTEKMAPVLKSSLRRFLTIVEPIHYDSDCLLGPYPVLADFAAHALLSHLQRDPTGEMMLLEDFPEFCAYLNQMEANSVARVERHDAWEARSKANKVRLDRLSEVLQYMAREFLAFHVANAAALAQGRADVSVELAKGEVYEAPATEHQRSRFRTILERLDGARAAGFHLLGGVESDGEREVYDQVARAKAGPAGKALFEGLKAL